MHCALRARGRRLYVCRLQCRTHTYTHNIRANVQSSRNSTRPVVAVAAERSSICCNGQGRPPPVSWAHPSARPPANVSLFPATRHTIFRPYACASTWVIIIYYCIYYVVALSVNACDNKIIILYYNNNNNNALFILRVSTCDEKGRGSRLLSSPVFARHMRRTSWW